MLAAATVFMPDTTFIQPDGQWCIYSTVVEEFVLEDATRAEVVEHHLERERREIERDLAAIEDGEPRQFTYEDAVEQSNLNG